VGSLLINQHTKRSGSNPASRFSFLVSRWTILYFYFFIFILFGRYQGKDRSEEFHPDAANADFFGPAAGQGPKNII
jgi:hypothetical protein